MSKDPSTRRRGVGRYRFADDYRVPFPGATPASISHAAYVLTPLGRVYRDDGFLLRPSADKLRVKLNGKSVVRSLPNAVYKAFGRKKMPPLWVVWVPPDAPIDEVTGRRSCSVKNVVLVNRGDLIRLAAGTIKLEQIKRTKIR